MRSTSVSTWARTCSWARRTLTAFSEKSAAEWSARAELEEAGWKRVLKPASVEPGTRVIVLTNSGGEVPASWIPLASARGEGRFPLRVVDVQGHVGLYAETLGVLPFASGSRPLDVAVLYEVGG